MPLSAASTSLAEILDEMTAEGASELTEHLADNALHCFACGHRCLIKEGKRGICKVRFNQGGHLRVPEGPGLGIEINESVIDRYPWIPGPWSFFRIDSPAETLAVTSDHSVKWEGKAAG